MSSTSFALSNMDSLRGHSLLFILSYYFLIYLYSLSFLSSASYHLDQLVFDMQFFSPISFHLRHEIKY